MRPLIITSLVFSTLLPALLWQGKSIAQAMQLRPQSALSEEFESYIVPDTSERADLKNYTMVRNTEAVN